MQPNFGTSPVNDSAMASIGRLMQISGLILPLVAIILQLERAIEVKPMLLLLVMSLATFYLGRIIEGYSRPQ
jgi:hypothetical protein